MADIKETTQGLYALKTYLASKAIEEHGPARESLIGMQKVVDSAVNMLKEQEEEIENLKQTAQSMMEGICLLKEQETSKKNRLPYSPDSNVQWT